MISLKQFNKIMLKIFSVMEKINEFSNQMAGSGLSSDYGKEKNLIADVEKIKKLAALSSKIIEEYGMSYFLKIATHEIWRQKLDLLRSDIAPKISLEKEMENGL